MVKANQQILDNLYKERKEILNKIKKFNGDYFLIYGYSKQLEEIDFKISNIECILQNYGF